MENYKLGANKETKCCFYNLWSDWWGYDTFVLSQLQNIVINVYYITINQEDFSIETTTWFLGKPKHLRNVSNAQCHLLVQVETNLAPLVCNRVAIARDFVRVK